MPPSSTRIRMTRVLMSLIGIGSMLVAGGESLAAKAKPPAPIVAPALGPAPTYADLVDLAEGAPLVMRARVLKVAEIKPAKGIGKNPVLARVYIEAAVENLLAGPAAVGETLKYLADVPRDAKGKLPKFTKQSVLLFARPAPGRAGEIQLIAPGAQIGWDPAREAELRRVLTELFAADAPRRVSRVYEASHVPGNLAGEGETQIFLATPDGEPASITVLHHPGTAPHWGVSFSEVVATTGLPPARETLAWYRLACFLPQQLPADVNVSPTIEAAAQAGADYQQVMRDLGPCLRNRK